MIKNNPTRLNQRSLIMIIACLTCWCIGSDWVDIILISIDWSENFPGWSSTAPCPTQGGTNGCRQIRKNIGNCRFELQQYDLAEAAYQQIERLLTLAYETVRGCSCSDGCPACIQSSNCRRGNEALDKQGRYQVRLREATSGGEVEQLEDVVEHRGVRPVGVDDRQDAGQVGAEDLGAGLGAETVRGAVQGVGVPHRQLCRPHRLSQRFALDRLRPVPSRLGAEH